MELTHQDLLLISIDEYLKMSYEERLEKYKGGVPQIFYDIDEYCTFLERIQEPKIFIR